MKLFNCFACCFAKKSTQREEQSRAFTIAKKASLDPNYLTQILDDYDTLKFLYDTNQFVHIVACSSYENARKVLANEHCQNLLSHQDKKKIATHMSGYEVLDNYQIEYNSSPHPETPSTPLLSTVK